MNTLASPRLNSQPPRIAVAGISGYAGAELARLLLAHPRLTPGFLLFLGRPGEEAATPLDEIHPQLTGLASSTPIVEPFTWERLAGFGAELLLLATPPEQSRAWAPIAIERGLRVIDLSGAWRLQHEPNRATYQLVDSDAGAAATLQAESVYGAPELHRKEIAAARLVANPGCYATSIILALAPLLHSGLVDLDRGIICDSKSGVSGAGKTPTSKTHFMYAADNLSAYAVFGHRHTGELLEQLSLDRDQIQFTPHLLPIPRGILSTIYVRLKEVSAPKAIAAVFQEFYKASPLVRVRSAGTLPQIQQSVRTNFCDLGFELAPDGKRMVLISCLDNLLKGAAGQAVQNLNLMFGWAEAEGLK